MPTTAAPRASGHLKHQLAPLRKPPYRVGRSMLPNGLRLVTVETPHLHTAAISLYVRAGSRYETPRTNGLSHFVEHMLFRGSSQFPNSFALNLAIEEIGGTLYAETGRDYSLYQIPLQPAELPRGLEILGDLFSTPSFRDIDLERQIIIEEILEDLDDDGRNVNLDDLSRLAAWDGHPLGYTITGPLRNVRRFKVDEVRAHFQHFYGATNMVLCVAGPVPARARRAAGARRVRRRVPRGKRDARRARRASRRAGRASASIHNESAQTQVQILFHAAARERSRLPGAARARRACSTTGCRRGCTTRSATRRGWPTRCRGHLHSYHDSALLEIDAACAHAKLPDAGRRGAVDPGALPRRAGQRGGARQGQAPLLAPTSRPATTISTACAAGSAAPSSTARPRSQEQRARELDRVRPDDIRRVARRVICRRAAVRGRRRRARSHRRAQGRDRSCASFAERQRELGPARAGAVGATWSWPCFGLGRLAGGGGAA